MKKSSVSRTAKVHVFSDSVLCLEKDTPETTIKYGLGRQVDVVQEFTYNTELWTQFDGEPLGIRVEYFPGFTSLQLCNKVQEFMSKMSKSPKQYKGRIIFMSMFNDISCRSEYNEQECEVKRQPRVYLCK